MDDLYAMPFFLQTDVQRQYQTLSYNFNKLLKQQTVETTFAVLNVYPHILYHKTTKTTAKTSLEHISIQILNFVDRSTLNNKLCV